MIKYKNVPHELVYFRRDLLDWRRGVDGSLRISRWPWMNWKNSRRKLGRRDSGCGSMETLPLMMTKHLLYVNLLESGEETLPRLQPVTIVETL